MWSVQIEVGGRMCGGGWSLDYGYLLGLVVIGCSLGLSEELMVGFGSDVVFRCYS